MIIVLTSIYIFIPAQVNLYQHIEISVTENNCSRFLTPNRDWVKWWPEKQSFKIPNTKKPTFIYQNTPYRVRRTTYSKMEIDILQKDFTIKSKISFFSTSNDHVKVIWQYNYTSSLNPIKRVYQRLYFDRTDTQINSLLRHLKKFLEYEPHIYGFDISLARIKDSILVATKVNLAHYPEASFVNQKIVRLKQLIADSGRKQTGHPMLNVTPIHEGGYQITVAVPIDNPIAGDTEFFTKRMIMGNFLETTVRGGQHTIDEAHIQMENYIRDHRMTSPAIPFESLITNRATEKDTSKWISKVYYPIL